MESHLENKIQMFGAKSSKTHCRKCIFQALRIFRVLSVKFTTVHTVNSVFFVYHLYNVQHSILKVRQNFGTLNMRCYEGGQNVRITKM